MKFIKKYFKIFIGAGVVLATILVFARVQQSADLANGTLKQWKSANADERATAIATLVGTDTNNELMVACVDKMSTLPDSAEMAIADAARLCNLGVQLKQNL